MPARWIEYVALDDLRAAPRNPKAHDMEGLAASVDRFGYVEPIVEDGRTGRLVAGHGRLEHLRTAQAEGSAPPEGVEVDPSGRWMAPVVKGWRSRSDADAEGYLVTSNRQVEQGGWKDDELAAMLGDLADAPGGLIGTGYGDDDLTALLASLQPPDPDPWRDRNKRDLPDPGSFTGGQVWDVGPHRLIVGDARSAEVWPLLPRPHLVVTDPPYGIGYDGGGGVERETLDGDATPDEAAALLDAVLARLNTHAESGAACYVFLSPGDAFPRMLAVLDRHGLARWTLVWVKDRATFGRADYHQRHEHVSYGWWPGSRLVPVVDRKLTTVWEFPRPRSSEHHPTAKPTGLLLQPILNSSIPGHVVLDPFAGSGSTLVAAIEAGRIGCGIELRPEYARVAVERMAAAAGVPAVQVV